MINNNINGRIRRGQQFLFLNQQYVVGIQSLEIRPNLNLNPLKFIGMGDNPLFTPYPNASIIGDLNVEGLLINNDPFINYTGDALVNGYLLQSPENFNNNYCLTSGFLINYNCKYQIGEIPTISTQWGIANVMGELSYTELSLSQQNDINAINSGIYNTGIINAPNAGSIILNIGDFQTNRLQNFEISIGMNKVPIYNVGQKYPSRIQLLRPLNVTCNFTFEVGQYTFLDKNNFPQYIKNNNLNLQVNSAWNNIPIANYTFNNLFLTDETYHMGINNSLSCSVTYQTYN